MKKRLSKLKTKLLNRIFSFNDVEKCFQEIEKRLNEFSESMNPSAESEVSDKDGKTGDIKTTRNTDGSYIFEIRTEEGWRTPVIPGGQSPIKYIEKASNIKKPIVKSIEDIVTEDLNVGESKAKKTIFDEKNDKFIMPSPDYDSGWFDIKERHQYVTGATTGVVPDNSYIYDDADLVVGIPTLGFTLERYPSLTQVLFSSYKTTSFEQSFDGKTGSNGTNAVVVISADGTGQYYHSGGGMGIRILMSNKEHICLSVGDHYSHHWEHSGGANVSSNKDEWTDEYDSDGGGSDANISCRFKLWK